MKSLPARSPARVRALAVAAALLAPLPGQAATTCSAGSVSMGLGVYDVFNAAPMDSSATFIVTCTRDGGPRDTVVTVGLGPSVTTGSVVNRATKHAFRPDLLAYNLFRDAGRSLVWGETVGINTLSQGITVPNKASRTVTFTIFGRAPARQDVSVGSYSDRLVITVNFQ